MKGDNRTTPRTGECTTPGKAQHQTLGPARAHMFSLIRNSKGRTKPGSLHVYACPGGHWHVGHIKPRKPQRRKKRRR